MGAVLWDWGGVAGASTGGEGSGGLGPRFAVWGVGAGEARAPVLLPEYPTRLVGYCEGRGVW